MITYVDLSIAIHEALLYVIVYKCFLLTTVSSKKQKIITKLKFGQIIGNLEGLSHSLQNPAVPTVLSTTRDFITELFAHKNSYTNLKKSGIQGTLNIFTCADIRTNKKNNI